jgi:TonB family protein
VIKNDHRILIICALLALLFEGSVLTISGLNLSFPVHHEEVDVPPAEMEVVTIPEEKPELKSEAAAPAKAEETLSQKTNASSAPSKSLSEPTQNIIAKGKPLSPTHGPVLIESPSPVIPEYLKSKDLNAKVVIEFAVLSTGEVHPKLLVSSGNEELDQIALATAKKWKFYPAENNHQAIAASVRLRILFEVK